jgi:hypothetical protein
LVLTRQSTTFDEPWGKNPFPEGTPAHQSWTETNLWTKEHLALLHSEMLESMPPEEASAKEFLDHRLKGLGGAFDIWACALARSAVLSDQAAGIFEQVLIEFERPMAENAIKFPVSFLPEGIYSREVKRRLHQRKQYWIGQMLGKVREHKEAACANDPANRSDGAEPGGASIHEPKANAERDGDTPQSHEAAADPESRWR